MLKALAEGETDPAALASLADHRLRASQEQLQDALGACEQLHGVYRRLLTMALEELQLIERQMEQLDQEISGLPGVPARPRAIATCGACLTRLPTQLSK
jgi:transposase